MNTPNPMKSMLDYLAALEEHNERAWYHAHKPALQQAQETFFSFLQMLLFALGEEEAEFLYLNPRDLTFRIPRDARLYRDKPPYHPAFRANLSPKGKVPIPCACFLCLRPGGRSFIGGGLFASGFRGATLRVRDHLDRYGEEWLSVIQDVGFAQHFTVEGERLKNVPREYDRDHPLGEFLKHKSWYAKSYFSDEEVLAEDFLDQVLDRIRLLRPLNGFLNEALSGYQLPNWE